MGYLVINNPFLSIILIFLVILFVVRLLKAKNRPQRSEQLGGCTTPLSRFKGTAAVSWGYDWGQDDNNQAAFTDSWEKELGQHVDNHSVFTDRAFQ